MDYIFVYGTLLSTARDTLGAAMRARLSGEALALGSAAMPGRLYDLGDYPGMVEVERYDSELVQGEVYRLLDAAGTFRWLDVYEDVDPVKPSEGLYRRVPQLALLSNGQSVRCWVYVLNTSPPEARRIVSGNWLMHETN